MKPQEMARAADTYTANMGEKSFPDSRPRPTTETHGAKNSTIESYVAQGIKGPTRPPQPGEGERREGTWRDRNRTTTTPTAANNTRPRIQCYNCSGPHLARNCPNSKRINKVTVEGMTERAEELELWPETIVNETEEATDNKMDQACNTDNMIYKVSVCDETDRHEVMIEMNNNKIKCIVDSGADISVLHSDLVAEQFKEPRGRIRLKGAFGHTVDADVMTIPIRLLDDNSNNPDRPDIYTLITVAVTPMLDAEVNCLLTPRDLKLLEVGEVDIRAGMDEQTERQFKTQDDGANAFSIREGIDADLMPDNDPTVLQKSNLTKLISDQVEDETLNECFIECHRDDSKYYLRQIDGVLFHVGEVMGRKTHQLVLPKNRRDEVIRLAHDSEWAGHLAAEKTYQRIAVSFFWPHMRTNINEYCRSCMSCQMKRRKTCWDRVPIEPVVRPETAFEVMNYDVIGPFENKSRGYCYVLTCVDQFSRWPAAVPLRNLYSKTICEALLWIFAHTGIPKVLVADNASYNTSGLSEEFRKRLGVTPRFSTPYHAEGNSIVERYNAVIKGMIHHVIRSGTKEWDRALPFLLWAYREMPNATTNVSPYELIHGKPARGPLAILKETWTGEQTIPGGLSPSAVEYLQQLKEKLEIAKKVAEESAKTQQQRYVNNYNLRSREKAFDVGDKVILLMSDSNSKLYSRWTGPAKVRKKVSEHSYDVELMDGTVRRLHANHLRKFVERVAAVGIVYETDEEFGDLEYIPSMLANEEEVDEKFKKLDLRHLTERQQEDILKIILKHKEVFSDQPGLCDPKIATHHIKVTANPRDWPKQSRPYRVPPIFRQEVDRQIDELLRNGMIEPSTSPIAHPLVCVSKPDRTIRLCCDNRYINSLTQPDPFPMRLVDDILDQVGASKYITGLDATSGYWQISVDEDSRPYTSFVTHNGAWQWTRLNFGLRNAAATYQRAMEKILKEHSRYATAYIDDVSVYSMHWEEHCNHLNDVLETIKTAGFKLRLSKCKFAQSRIKLLGQIVGSNERKVDPQKVEAVLKLKTFTGYRWPGALISNWPPSFSMSENRNNRNICRLS